MRLNSKVEAQEILLHLDKDFDLIPDAAKICQYDHYNLQPKHACIYVLSNVVPDTKFECSVGIFGSILDEKKCIVQVRINKFTYNHTYSAWHPPFLVCSFFKQFDSTQHEGLVDAVELANALYKQAILRLIDYMKTHTTEVIKNMFEELSQKIDADNFFSQVGRN